MRRLWFLSLMTIGLGPVWAAVPAVAGDHKPPVIQCGTPTPPPHCDPPFECGTPPSSVPPAPATPVVRDHRKPKPGPVVRDHRTTDQGPTIRDHRTTPQQGPIVRDHRTPPYTVPTYTVPPNRPPVVNTPPVKSPYKDPRGPDAGNAPGGVVVTQSPVVNRPYNSQQNSTKRPRRLSSGSSLPIPKLPIVIRLPF